MGIADDALTFHIAFVARWLLWVARFVVIWPLATMALMALPVLWKDSTTSGKLLVRGTNFVKRTTPVGQFLVSGYWLSSSDSSGRSEIQGIRHYRAADAIDYVRETDRSLMQLVTAFWATLALMYMSLVTDVGKYPTWPGKTKCARVGTADEHLKEVCTGDASLSEKIRKCLVYFHNNKTDRSNGGKNEHV